MDDRAGEMSGSRFSEPSTSAAEMSQPAKGKPNIKNLFKKQFRRGKENSDSSPGIDRFHGRNAHIASSPMAANQPSYMFSEQAQEEQSFQEQFMQINKERQEMIRKFELEIKDLKSQLEAEKAKSALANKLMEDMLVKQDSNNDNNDNTIPTKNTETGDESTTESTKQTSVGDTNNTEESMPSEKDRENTSITLLRKMTEENGSLTVKLKETEEKLKDAESQIKTLKQNMKNYTIENSSYRQLSEK